MTHISDKILKGLLRDYLQAQDVAEARADMTLATEILSRVKDVRGWLDNYKAGNFENIPK